MACQRVQAVTAVEWAGHLLLGPSQDRSATRHRPLPLFPSALQVITPTRAAAIFVVLALTLYLGRTAALHVPLIRIQVFLDRLQAEIV